MNNLIVPCVWCHGNAREMAEFYLGVFKNSRVLEENFGTVLLEIEGKQLRLLNGGNEYQPNPSISLMLRFDEVDGVDEICQQLAEGGKLVLAPGQYSWSERYCWLNDKYGVSWQILVKKYEGIYPGITHVLMFMGENFGKAYEAIQFYLSVFKDSSLELLTFYGEGQGESEEVVEHGELMIGDSHFIFMDTSVDQEYNFSPGLSLMVNCKTQADIDYYWQALSAGGGSEGQCGWLEDKFHLSWQVTPEKMASYFANPATSPAVAGALMPMRKIDMAALEAAARGES